MTILKEQLNSVRTAGAALAQAKANHAHASASLWKSLQPIVGRHQKEVGDLFDAAGLSDNYESRFGTTRGERLTSISTSERFLEVGLVEYFRGEAEHFEFRLPLLYLEDDPKQVLERELAHYRRVFERLDRLQRVRDEAETRAENLKELARLAELLKNDPEATAALAAIAPTEKA
jgi:hypothetical protein